MPESPLEVVQDGPLARVTLNRSDKLNAVNRPMFEAFHDVGSRLAEDRRLRAVVLTGAGGNFCAGIDVSTFSGAPVDPATLEPLAGTPANIYQRAASAWRDLPVPVIAALEGAVFGAGLQIALGADIRIAHPDARLSIMEVKWGLMPDMALSTTITPLVRYDKAAELTFTGRIVDAREAKELGLVTRIDDDPLAAAERLAESVATQSPDAVRAAKRLLRAAYVGRDAELLRLEAELQAKVMAAGAFREAVAANLEKREPEFGDAEL